MAAVTSLLTLNNGVQMPALGLGVYQSSADETVSAVATALATGYRLIDTAAAYGNEAQVGEAVRASGFGRSDIFVTNKVWISDYGDNATLHAFDRSQRLLDLDTLDLYLLHWPMPTDFEATLGAWRAAEKLLDEGRVRAIGVSNFSPKHLENLIANSEVVPAVNQVELHPFFVQEAVHAVDKKLGIVTQAWSPIGGVNRYMGGDSHQARDPLTNPTLIALASKYGKTPAQIVLRWHLELGISAIPKSVKPHRITENADVFDFSLDGEEVQAISALDSGVRGGPDPELVNTDMFSFKIED